MKFIQELWQSPLTLTCLLLTVVVVAAGAADLVLSPKLFALMLKNLRRNLLRTGLTSLAIVALAFVVTLILSVIFFIERETSEKAADVKLIVAERWQIPSLLPLTHADALDPQKSTFLPELKGLYGPNDFMTWSFYGGSVDPKNVTADTIVFLFCMRPEHIKTMMEDLENLDDSMIDALKKNKQGVLMGRDRMKAINRKLGETFKLYSMNYKEIDLEFTIVGVLPDGRYNSNAIANASYLTDSLDLYKQQKGKDHVLAQQPLNLIWLRVRDQETFSKVAHIVENAPEFSSRQVKCETASSTISSFLDSFRDIFAMVKWVLVPSIFGIMALVVSLSIAITVRERMTEMAVLKVLGFKPEQIQMLVLGEALLVGGAAGFLAGSVTYLFVNFVMGGIRFPIAFFPAFLIPWQALFWCTGMGFATGLIGSFFPAWSARSVKVSNVFARVG